ncbi:hydroxyacylglutathione hydrolase [Chelonobacter oris]|uniref:Hydroxyacylglutathione hydrolase n=1 Tax=Chelonobacter oris TaxID=505317 RepID=A0A0A3ATH0_9PAST|nr:hydroxyacylglutathione hydrolase [Chelonobacter oris]KGQ71067.1 hydroxyacylglutathione hydrolase [Chelonobacter oris]
MLIPLPALNDNYIWLYADSSNKVLIVDPAEADGVIDYLTDNRLEPQAILLTHGHQDHIGGVAALKVRYPDLPVYGSQETANLALNVENKAIFQSGSYRIQVITTAGHTAHHISFVVDNCLFCGDSLFSAGCGRVFTADYQAMFDGLQRLKSLPDETLVCAGHEYTLSNLRFALTVTKEKNAVSHQLEKVTAGRQAGKPSLPTTLGLERQINPFLQAATLQEFITLRQAKDQF